MKLRNIIIKINKNFTTIAMFVHIDTTHEYLNLEMEKIYEF